MEGQPKQFSAEEVSAFILSKMKETAEAYLGRTVTDAVVTVPGEGQRAVRLGPRRECYGSHSA